MPEKSVEDYAVIWCWGAYSACLLPMECWGWKVISQFYYWLKIKIGSIFHSSLKIYGLCISSVQFSRSVVSDSLRPHELQHARPPCPSPTPGVHSDSRPMSQWCHPAISSSVVPFSSCPQSLPAWVFCFTTSTLSWFMDLTFQVPMQYCSLQHRALLPSSVTSTAGCVFALALSFRSFWTYFSTLFQQHIGHLTIWGVHLSVPYLFAFLCYSWASQGKNTEVVCHSLL